ncbi:hypothetical protein ABT288_43145 [Streptomyces sp. NPDC001093]|uniref:hypothetical protein n=1 Tax=Streptomyces sp. NPDC001093 TaxID=3154376 RepID=UPI00331D796A
MCFHALRPAGTWLDFYFFPGPDGISVRVVQTALANRPPALVPVRPLRPAGRSG